MDFNPINNNLHTPTHKLPIINNWEKEGFSIMDLEDHHPHPHPHQHHHHQHENHHNHHHHISIHDPIWHTYHHNLPRSPPPPPIISSSSSSSSSMMTIKQFPLLQEQILVENDDDELLLLGEEEEEEEEEELGAMKEMMYRIAVMQPVDIDPASIRKPKRRNVRISNDPQSVAARHRRERISERIRILQRLVPGGTKMDTASMLDEAIRYVKFLKRQIRQLQLQQQQQQPSSSNHHPPPVPALPPSDWPPLGSLVGPSGNSKAVLIRDKNNNNNNNNHINEGMMVFQHGGN